MTATIQRSTRVRSGAIFRQILELTRGLGTPRPDHASGRPDHRLALAGCAAESRPELACAGAFAHRFVKFLTNGPTGVPRVRSILCGQTEGVDARPRSKAPG